MTDTPNDGMKNPEPGSERPGLEQTPAEQTSAEQAPVGQTSSVPENGQGAEPSITPEAPATVESVEPASTPAATPTPAATSTPTAASTSASTPDAAPAAAIGAFGQPMASDPNVAPHTAEQAYAGTAPYATQPTMAPAQKENKAAKKHSTGLIIASLAVGALIGGAAGGGIGVGVYAAAQGNGSRTVTSTGASNITVNNTKSATVVTAVAAKASPSVVTISVTGTNEGGTGSGIVLSKDGYILTNTHVVTLDGQESNVKVQVQDNNGKLYDAKVVATDPIVDLAVIKVENVDDMTPATFADSSKLNVGDTAVAIGSPLGLTGTVTDGIISALNRSITIASSAAPDSSNQGNGDNGENGPYDLWNFDFPGDGEGSQSQTATDNTISLPVIQTDASINHGNSGGALLNDQGEVIGVNVAIASAGGSSSSSDQSGSIGVGFAIPSNLAQRVANELIKNHKASHGLLGAMVQNASASNSSDTVGALIHSVTSGGAAEKAGIKAGDIVTNFNGRPITGSGDLTAQVRFLAGGSTADLTYVRNGKTYTVTVTLGTMAN